MKNTFLILLLLATTFNAFADSPLTSTMWWEHYKNNAVIVEASTQGCTDKVMALICDDNTPLDLRLAAANALGWNVNGQENFERCHNYYLNQIRAKYHVPLYDSIPDIYVEYSPETYCVFGYLKAMDDYLEVSTALLFAFKAHQLKPTSRGIEMILSLITAQIKMTMSDDWCGVYQVVADVAYDKSQEKDVSDKMVDEIMDYIKNYRNYCQ